MKGHNEHISYQIKMFLYHIDMMCHLRQTQLHILYSLYYLILYMFCTIKNNSNTILCQSNNQIGKKYIKLMKDQYKKNKVNCI